MLNEPASPHIRCCLSAIPSDLMKSTAVDESLSSMNQQFCSRENQLLQMTKTGSWMKIRLGGHCNCSKSIIRMGKLKKCLRYLCMHLVSVHAPSLRFIERNGVLEENETGPFMNSPSLI